MSAERVHIVDRRSLALSQPAGYGRARGTSVRGAHADVEARPDSPPGGGTHPDRSVAQPAEIAEAVTHVSEKLAHVTGLALVVDGGMTSTIMI
jgi:NAD(P)-dependent dehydrogenase (short-subunit alcohol dehydrogenase family)